MEATARNVETAHTDVVFEDGLGLRYLVTGPSGEPVGETLVIRPALVGARSFEFALRERVARLSTLSHSALPKLRAVDRTSGPDATLRLVSDQAQGARLSLMLEQAYAHEVHLDIGSALSIIRQLVSAVAALHESARDLSHGAIALERTIITPEGRLLVVEHGLGAALQQLRYTPKRYWSELRVALPPTPGPVLFDQRVDVVQIGVIALGLLLGRSLRDNEVPNRTGDLVGAARAVSLRGGAEPLPSGLRRWLTRTLQLDPLRSFSSALDARAELDVILEATDEHASLVCLEAFLERLERATAPAPAEIFPREAAAAPKAPPRRDVDLAGIDAALARPGQMVSKLTIAVDGPDEDEQPALEAQAAQDAAPAQVDVLTPVDLAPPVAAPAVLVPPAVVVEPPQPPVSQIATPDAELPSQLSASTTLEAGTLEHATLAEAPAAGTRPVPAFAFSPVSAAAFSVLRPAAPLKVTLAPSVAAPTAPASDTEDAVVSPEIEVLPAPERATLLTFSRPETKQPEPDSAPAPSRETLRMDAIDAAMDAAAGAAAARVSSQTSRTTARSSEEWTAADLQPGSVATRSDLSRALMAGVVPAVLSAFAGYAAAGGGLFAPVRVMSPGLVEVTTGPAGVAAFVDGTYRGLTPLRLSLAPGPHAIELQRPDAEPVSVPVTLAPGMKLSQFVDMPLAMNFGLDGDDPSGVGQFAELPGRLVDTGSVSVVSEAVLQIVEGDTPLGTSRDTLELPVGPHDLTLIDETSGIYTTRSIVVDMKKPAVLKVAMPTGVLAVSATPRAEVWVDGNRRGETPISALTLRAGAHDVVFRHPDLGDHKRAVVVTAGNVLRLNVDLRTQ